MNQRLLGLTVIVVLALLTTCMANTRVRIRYRLTPAVPSAPGSPPQQKPGSLLI